MSEPTTDKYTQAIAASKVTEDDAAVSAVYIILHLFIILCNFQKFLHISFWYGSLAILVDCLTYLIRRHNSPLQTWRKPLRTERFRHSKKVYFFVMIFMEKFLYKYHKKKGLSLLTYCR